jgi:TRAP-type C4-dicarboxylate transport system substrate-binding protein
MKHWILKTAIAGVACTALASAAWSQQVLKLASFVPPKYVLHKPIFLKLAADLDAATKGAVKIKVYPSGELGKGPVAQYQRAVKRIAEISYGLPGYTSTLFPQTLLIELPGVSKGYEDATNKIWNVMDKYLRAEFKRTVPLAVFVTPPSVFMMRDKPIRTPADLKGLKIRVPSKSAAAIVQAYGATPVPMPATKVYTAMSTGVVDGALMGSDSLLIFKLIEPSKFVTVGLPEMPTAIFMVMNEAAYKELSPAHRKALDGLTGRKLSLASAKGLAGFGGLALKKFKAIPGKTVITLTPEARKQFDALAAQGVANVIKGLEGRNIPAGAVVKAMKN